MRGCAPIPRRESAHIQEHLSMEAAILVMRLITPHGPEMYQRAFPTHAKCQEAQQQWVELIDSIDPQRFRLGYAACVRPEQV